MNTFIKGACTAFILTVFLVGSVHAARPNPPVLITGDTVTPNNKGGGSLGVSWNPGQWVSVTAAQVPINEKRAQRGRAQLSGSVSQRSTVIPVANAGQVFKKGDFVKCVVLGVIANLL